jgi:hypothetical protein
MARRNGRELGTRLQAARQCGIRLAGQGGCLVRVPPGYPRHRLRASPRGGLLVRALSHEKPHHLNSVVRSGQVHGGVPAMVNGVDHSPPTDQTLHALKESVLGRQVEWSAAAIRLRLDVRPVLDENRQHRRAPYAGNVKRRIAPARPHVWVGPMFQ